MAAGTGGYSYRSASPIAREQVIDILKAAFVQGRLARDEFDLRVGQALASRTYADLTVLTADIPAGLTGAQLSHPAGKPADKDAATAVACVSAAWTAIWIPPVIVGGFHSVATLVLAIVLMCVVPVLLAGVLLYHEWLDRRVGRMAFRS